MARLNGFEYRNRSRGCDRRAVRRISHYDPVFTRRKHAQSEGQGVCVVYEEVSASFQGVLSACRAPRALGRCLDESGWWGGVFAVGIMLWGDRVAVGVKTPMVVGCLIHRADDPSFDASVARAHWASTLRSGTVRAAVGSLLTLLSVVERVDGVRCAGSRRLAGAEICRPRPYHGSNRWVPGRRASNRGYLRAY